MAMIEMQVMKATAAKKSAKSVTAASSNKQKAASKKDFRSCLKQEKAKPDESEKPVKRDEKPDPERLQEEKSSADNELCETKPASDNEMPDEVNVTAEPETETESIPFLGVIAETDLQAKPIEKPKQAELMDTKKAGAKTETVNGTKMNQPVVKLEELESDAGKLAGKAVNKLQAQGFEAVKNEVLQTEKKTGQATKGKHKAPGKIDTKEIINTMLNRESSAAKGDEQKTNIKELMNFENQRLNGKKLSSAEGDGEPRMQVQSSDEGNKNISIADRLQAEWKLTANRTGTTTNVVRPQIADKEILDQMLQKFELVSKNESSEMRIQLKPDFLGKMMIKIAVDDSGIVTARFITESHHVKQVLEANMHSLKQNLEASGLKVERTEVNVQLDNQGSFDGSEQNRHQMWEQAAGGDSNKHDYNDLDRIFTSEEAEAAVLSDVLSSRGLDNGKVDFMI